ncbi:MAG: glycosyltransferase [Gemmatimonadota bacterium]|nr:MAG: glycosyltransferase [Gemmatimonadota bacterium]
MRICIITHCFPRFKNDVFGNWTPDFAHMLMEKGQEVSILTPRMAAPVVPGDVSDWPFRVDYFDWGRGETRLGNLSIFNPFHVIKLATFLRNGVRILKSLVETLNIDLCLGIWAIPGGYLSYRVHQETGVPYAVWALGSDINVYGRNPVFRPVIKKVLVHADYLFANSRNLIAKVSQWSGKTCAFMPTNRVLPQERVAPLEKTGGKKTFVYIGRLERVKGVDVLIEALAKLRQEGCQAELHIVGDGEEKSVLEKSVSEARLGDRVSFAGWASPAEVTSYIRASDAVVLPSRSEGMPVVFWEAMQMNTPVIVTDVGDMAEYTRKYGVGKVVPPENPAALKEALREFIEDHVHINYANIAVLAEESSLAKATDTFLHTISPPRRNVNEGHENP